MGNSKKKNSENREPIEYSARPNEKGPSPRYMANFDYNKNLKLEREKIYLQETLNR